MSSHEMKNLESIRIRAEAIAANEPIWAKAFPPVPWSYDDLEEIAGIVEHHLLRDEVISEDPWVDWLDRWKFYKSTNER